MALLDDIEAFLAETKMAPSRFDREVNNKGFLSRLRAGKTPGGRPVWVRPETEAMVRDIMARHRAPKAERVA